MNVRLLCFGLGSRAYFALGNGTVDWAPYLSVSAALDFRKWLGGEGVIDRYCHNLAIEGGKTLAKVLNTKVMDEDGQFTAHMVFPHSRVGARY